MDTADKTVASLFSTMGIQWGLRGDPYLWDEMRGYFADTPLPKTAVSFQNLIKEAFTLLTSHPFPTEADLAPIPIKRFDHGGMSSGLVSPDFWRNKAIPELTNRYNEAKS